MADPGTKSKSAQGSVAGTSLGKSGQRDSTRSGPAPAGSVNALPQPGDLVDAKYQVDRLLAQGGMGAVYAATHVVSGKRVALKWMLPSVSQLPDATERFVREARATARIDHPNVVDIYDVGNDGAGVYLVMELLQGETLHDRLARAALPVTQSIALLMPALRGVAAAHAHGVIHRDLKPDNIFLCQGPHGEPREPKVVDFGISKIAKSDHARDQGLTQSGVVMGTPYYMSPEQVRGTKELDERGDIYAFGVILYEMLAGQRPFQAETYNELILKIATEDPLPLVRQNPALDQRLAAVVERAMARAPEARFGSVEALALALEPFAGGVTFHHPSFVPGELGAAQPGPPRADVPAMHTRLSVNSSFGAGARPWLMAGIVVGLLVGAALLWRARSVGREPAAHVVQPAPLRTGTANAQAPSEPPPTAAQAPMRAPTPAQPPPPTAAETTLRAEAPQAQPPAPARNRHGKRSASAAAKTQAALPANWDERLPLAPSAAQPKTGPIQSAAGRISRDELR
ncbi:MAG TPA: serine/threonine-protein kinase [Polyangiales bacterium]